MMQTDTFTMLNTQGMHVFVYEWLPGPDDPIRAIVQIAHGMCETGKRYEELAELLTEHGYAVYCNDHRGHGLTAGLTHLGDAGEDGFEGMIEDQLLLASELKKRHASVPHYLMGHSMGSFLTQKIICSDGELFDGFILSGTNGPQGLLTFGMSLAAAQMRLQGNTHRSLMLNALVFGPYNKGFGPIRTPFDWLSRDEAEVDKYINDPYCGKVCTARFFRDFFKLLSQIHQPQLMKCLPKDKPVYIFSGEDDPVGHRGKGVRRLIELYRKHGVQDLEYRLYPGGRHEMLHETNRAEVAADVLDWLERHTTGSDNVPQESIRVM
ncbi:MULTISPECIES: alpha/beta hydrolase [unclassified Paenibacillus]|uniref:alpha/beta hydrolase n=1 Tax=unclassified Paenibacillus TaxID=185978 RepID=UPI001787A2FB|nr:MULTISPECIES: alpha/beta hydrolase [unclassified Paenibacillus]QOT10494.1 alpha/beta hydrolase [Paenibacillus sp. JNUCC-32]WFB57384.1 lysophospholipase [Paenibacillus sp. BR1-192]